MSNPQISVIVPTKNSLSQVARLIESLNNQSVTDLELIINDSPDSVDALEKWVDRGTLRFPIVILKTNISMAQARLEGSKQARSTILLHLDSDMKCEKDLISECINLMNRYDALVIPERSIGQGFWGKCKVLEKEMYQGIEQLESARCIRKSIYDSIGGHDPDMVFSEDKDLDIRIRKAGLKIGRTKSSIIHDDGDPSLMTLLKKKIFYGNTANIFASKHPGHFAWQANPFNRYAIYVINYKCMLKDPAHYLGLFLLKTVEFASSAFVFINNKRRR